MFLDSLYNKHHNMHRKPTQDEKERKVIATLNEKNVRFISPPKPGEGPIAAVLYRRGGKPFVFWNFETCELVIVRYGYLFLIQFEKSECNPDLMYYPRLPREFKDLPMDRAFCVPDGHAAAYYSKPTKCVFIDYDSKTSIIWLPDAIVSTTIIDLRRNVLC